MKLYSVAELNTSFSPVWYFSFGVEGQLFWLTMGSYHFVWDTANRASGRLIELATFEPSDYFAVLFGV